MHSRFINDTVDLFTESFGDPKDPAILLIMGAMASGVWWPQEFCERLAANERFVIRYDHRDTGASTSYQPGVINYTVEDLADDAVRILEAYKIEQAHLAGMSVGGYLSQLIALKYPQRVLTLTLIASEPLITPDGSTAWIDPSVLEYHTSAANLDWSDRTAVIDYQVGAWKLLTGPGHAFDEQHIRLLAETDFDRTPDPTTAFNHAQLSGGQSWLDKLDEIKIPTLIIHGTDDIVVRYPNAAALKQHIPHAKLLMLEGTGHELHPADWDRIVGAIANHTK